jgi:long-chain acyl-CoA synthetase
MIRGGASNRRFQVERRLIMTTTHPLYFSPQRAHDQPHANAARLAIERLAAARLGIAPDDTLDGVFRRRVAQSPDAIAYTEFDADAGRWRDFTWADTAREAARWQAALATLGLAPGARVALMLRNCHAWIAFDQAALGLGLVTVPLYPSDRAANIDWVLKDADCEALLIEDAGAWAALDSIRPTVAALCALISLAPLADAPANHRLADAWLPSSAELVAGRTRAHDLATLVYTSGTTGRPKGVMLSHRNLLFNVDAGLEAVEVRPDDLMLSFLPLSHTLERTIGYYLPVVAGSRVAFARSIPLLSEDLVAIRPTLLIAVPRIFDRVHGRIRETLAAAPALKQKLFARAVEVGWQAFLHRQGRAPWTPALLAHPVLDHLVGAKIRSKLGGRLRFAISGGAPLAPDIARFFIALGVPIVQGYGLTETSPVISVNRLGDNEPASVGPPLAGVAVRVGEHGELLTMSPSLCLGYWHNEAATRALIDADGWLHTGDQASIGPRGHIVITGRLKEILVLSTGEKAPPADIEQALATCPLLEQSMVVGDGRPYLAALVVPRAEALAAAAAKLGIAPDGAAMRSHVLGQLLPCLHDFPGYAKLGGVALIEEPFSVENGLLTPTLKLKRGEILRRYQAEADALYAGH